MAASSVRERRTRTRQDDLCQGSCVEGPFGRIQLSLDENVRRAIDVYEGDKIDEAAFKDLIGAAVALNLKSKSNPKSPPASSKRVG